MAYDPQRDRRRPKPSAEGPAPIESILDRGDPPPQEVGTPPGPDPTPAPDLGVQGSPTGPTSTGASVAGSVTDDPPPDPSVTPLPADPWSDRLLFGMSISTVVGVLVALMVFRWLWVRGRRSSARQGQ